MKDYIEKLQNNPSYAKIYEWGKLLSITTGAQLLIRAIGFISGILVIRFLSLEEYAFYTLANAFLGTMAVLGDGGISAGVLSQGGKDWQNKKKLGAILATGLKLRKSFALYTILVTLPILSFLLKENGASWGTIILVIVTLIPAFYAQLSDSLLDIVPKLYQDIPALQKNQVYVALGRLFLTVSLVFIFPFTFIALIANGVPRIYGNIQLKKIAELHIATEPPNNQIRRELIKTVKRVLPGAIYFCISGQITIWILSILGNTSGLAKVGALGKFGVVLSIIGTLASILFVPRFARQKEKKKTLLSAYLKVITVVLILLVFSLIIISTFPKQLLWVLGSNYQNLETELLLLIIGSCLAVLCGVMVSMNMRRNWIINPILSISISIISVFLGIFLFEVSELKGVLLFNIFLTLVQVGIHGSYGFSRIRALRL